jgi:hypothetical protein
MPSKVSRVSVWLLLLATPLLFNCSADQSSNAAAKHGAGLALKASLGACCMADGSCQILAPDACTTAAGTYQGDDTLCDPNPCPQPPPPPPSQGACCAADGSCSVETAAACTTASGTYQGDATVCDPNPCPQPPPPPPAEGACCAANGNCSVLTAAACATATGTYQGDATVCDPNPCPQPPPPPPAEGACCADDGTCSVLTSDACTAALGTYKGDATLCDPNPCPQPPPPAAQGACCTGRTEKCGNKPACSLVTADECADAGGSNQGDGTTCQPDPCRRPQEQGCGFAFWRHHPDAWSATPYAPGTLLNTVFTLPSSLDRLSGDTFMGALKYPCGRSGNWIAKRLLKSGVVALLNASHSGVHFSLTAAQVLATVNTALASGNRRQMMAAERTLDRHNIKYCPLL